MNRYGSPLKWGFYSSREVLKLFLEGTSTLPREIPIFLLFWKFKCKVKRRLPRPPPLRVQPLITSIISYRVATTKPMWFCFKVRLLIGPWNVYNYFWREFLHPPKGITHFYFFYSPRLLPLRAPRVLRLSH